ncbi:MAG TPA: DNA polymerase Y family protein [Candidatus Binatia bacterium]|nr:DNA polymerase Y family protein [Candidatus Binatia bacterium]
MPRIACLFVPDFPLAALRRAEPDLHGRPLVTVAHEGPRAPLTAVSAEARALGARAGLSAAEARTISNALLVRQPRADVLRCAEDALCDVADSFSPRVENAGGGVAFLEIDGLRSLFGAESHLATSLVARLRRIGLEGRVAVASTKTVAWLAARTSEGVDVVPAGEGRRRLGSLPISLLDPPDDVALTLERWGIRTFGQLAALPVTAVGWRFGETGIQLWRRAAGKDEEPLVVRPRPCRFEETIDCGYAIDSFEPLSFLLRAALERLTARLDLRGLRAGDLRLSLRLEDGGREEHSIAVAAPTNEVKSLLALARLHFDRRPPRAAVEWFRLSAVAERLRPIELDLFVPAGPSPQDLGVAIARLTAIAGAERVGSPTVLDSHRPEAFAVERFALTPPAPAQAEADRSTTNGSSPLALRAFRPPASIEVVCDRGRPDFVRGSSESETFGGRVVTLAGPWRLTGEWWREASFARDYYDAELSDGGIYRIYRERESGEWFADGVYD